MSAAPQTSYDELPYSHNPFYATHPDCLATVATLYGMTPAPVTRCRVLELGCASGGNLIPMAASLPDCSFVGIDLSSRQIDQGQEMVQALDLTNTDVLCTGHQIAHKVLEDDGDGTAELLSIEARRIDSVPKDPAFARNVQSSQQLC